MVVNTVYKLERGNQNKTAGLIVRGAGSSVTIYGSQIKPTQLSDMNGLVENNAPLTEGPWTFEMLTEFIYFVGTADRIDIIGKGVEELNIVFP